MPLLHLPDLLPVLLIFLGAGLVKGVLGMGLPTFAMGFLGLLMPLSQAAGLLTLPSLLTNAWQGFAGAGLRPLVRRLWPLQLGIACGVAVAALLPATGDTLGRRLLGASLLVYGLAGLAGWRLRAPQRSQETWTGLAVGVATGVVTGLTGVFVLPLVPWLQSLQLDREALTRALGLSFTTATIALAALLAARGQYGLAASLQSASALLPAFAGMALGQVLRRAMSEALFRRCFFLGLVALGGWSIIAGR